MILREAEDHKGLWEQEVLSRSKLGLRVREFVLTITLTRIHTDIVHSPIVTSQEINCRVWEKFKTNNFSRVHINIEYYFTLTLILLSTGLETLLIT
jgi:hypothetical protein